ncbi:MAG TPA: hypothetical protein VKH83_13285 [Methylomirabilota bacterium]|nr:hypothetical protein [Methylomirabilota bacterium]
MKTTKAPLLLAAILALGTLGSSGPAAALSATSTVDSRIRLDWQVGTGRSGQPLIFGYIYNDYGRPASDVVLYVESVDGSGAVVGHTYGFIRGVVQNTDRAYFEVPVQKAGASYRVSVTQLDWKGGGGAGM